MFYMVTLNGHPLRKWMTRAEADAMAERWQGSHCSYSGASGLLKIKDRGDHVEVKVDEQANREFNDRYRTYKEGQPQVLQYQQRVERLSDADEAMRG